MASMVNDTNELEKLYEAAVAEYEAAHPNVKINTSSTEAIRQNLCRICRNRCIDVFYWGGTARNL